MIITIMIRITSKQARQQVSASKPDVLEVADGNWHHVVAWNNCLMALRVFFMARPLAPLASKNGIGAAFLHPFKKLE
jgi:hypothetical protein